MGKRQPRFSEDEVHVLEMNPYTLIKVLLKSS